MNTIKVAAFGALNQGSYEMFGEWLDEFGGDMNINTSLSCAGSYPNEESVSEPGRPLRGEALQNEDHKKDLLAAVANDAKNLGDDFDYYCMPCLSMVGFHDGVQSILGKSIVRLDDAIKAHYASIDKVGVINMRPAQKRIEEIFGDKAVRPSDELAQLLVNAEGDTAAVQAVMLQIVDSYKAQGVEYVFFARADAPKAQKHLADQIEGIIVHSYFEILAKSILEEMRAVA